MAVVVTPEYDGIVMVLILLIVIAVLVLIAAIPFIIQAYHQWRKAKSYDRKKKAGEDDEAG